MSNPRISFKVKRKIPQNTSSKKPKTWYTPGGSATDADTAQPKPSTPALPELEHFFQSSKFLMVFTKVAFIDSLTVTKVMDEIRECLPYVDENFIRINREQGEVLVPFERMEDLMAHAYHPYGSLGTPLDPKTYDPSARRDIFYRSVLECSDILQWDSDVEIAEVIRKVADAKVTNGSINPSDNLITVYLASKNDWLKLEKTAKIFPTEAPYNTKPGFKVISKFASTNDPHIYKLYMSGLPDATNPTYLSNAIASHCGVRPLLVGLSFDRATNRSMRYCFVLVEGEEQRDKLLDSSRSATIKKTAISFALARPSKPKQNVNTTDDE